jgi:hypothetical protein
LQEEQDRLQEEQERLQDKQYRLEDEQDRLLSICRIGCRTSRIGWRKNRTCCSMRILAVGQAG